MEGYYGSRAYAREIEAIAALQKRIADLPAVRVDLNTFNYGAALGRPKHDAKAEGAPWERRDMATEYDAAKLWNDQLGAVMVSFTQAQWRMEMALRDVRNATTHHDQREAHNRLMDVWREVDTSLQTVKAGRLKWYRYGRVGDVLARMGV